MIAMMTVLEPLLLLPPQLEQESTLSRIINIQHITFLGKPQAAVYPEILLEK
jgi:hypothetical protein